MKKEYQSPELEVEVFDLGDMLDVLSGSGDAGYDGPVDGKIDRL